MDTRPPPRGFCISCGYPQQGLVAAESGYRCPECGRAFDPADPKTFRKTPHTRLTRWLARPVERSVVILSLLAAAGVMLVSRWKLSTFAPSKVDLVYYLRPAALWHRTSLVTWRDCVFSLSMLAAIFACLWWILRLIVGPFVRWHQDIHDDGQPTHTGRRHALLAIASFITAGGAALGWPYRLAQQWAARRLAANNLQPPNPHLAAPVIGPPTVLSTSQTEATLRAAVIQLPRVPQRMAGLKLLMEDHPQIALPILTEAVTKETDVEVRALELRLIGVHRDPSTTDLLMRFMNDPAPSARAAAADAIGILHEPTYSIPLGVQTFSFTPTPATTGSSPIDLEALVKLNPQNPRQYPYFLQNKKISLPSNTRDALQQMMLNGASTEEREAAARAMVVWPPEEYVLRVAEWGIWISDKGELKLIQSLLDEIPAFVHRTGDPIADFNDRIGQIVIVDKPIIHITVDQLTALDVNVIINSGRPWFAYPNPDDFAVDVETLYDQRYWKNNNPPVAGPLAPLDNAAIEKLKDIRQGYPWLTPHHIASGPSGSGMGGVNEITGLGLRWQSIIVSPTQLPWMTLPEVGDDPKFAWWKRLRDVPSSWVSSRGESERFLYYDGPTLLPTPVNVTLSGDQLRLETRVLSSDDPGIERLRQQRLRLQNLPNSLSPPQGTMLIHHRNGQLSGQTIPLPAEWTQEHPTFDHPIGPDDLHADQVIEQFRNMLTSAGLTTDEAEGLVASWQPQFFQTDGTRLLMIMSKNDYDDFCPITIRPTPTQLVRVGIILTEFE